MGNIIKIPLILAFFVIFTAGCIQQKNVTENPEIEMQENNDIDNVQISSFETDKEVYGSHENLEATIQLESAKETELKARLIGIIPYNFAHIDESKTLNLTQGKNEIVFNTKTPHCTSGCGGVYPGPYELTIELVADDEVVANSNTTIELVN